MAKNREKLEVGKFYITRGGWKVLALWEHKLGLGFWMIHKPGLDDEFSIPVLHSELGRAPKDFGWHTAPDYSQHPADVMGIWGEA